jgi:hypothetical protein
MVKKLPIEVQVEKEKTNRELTQEVVSTLRQIGVVLANSPAIQTIGALVLIELIQRIRIQDKPLISDVLANTMTGAVVAKAATSSISDIISLINPFD